MTLLKNDFRFPASSCLLGRWQAGDHAATERLRGLFDAVIEGQYDAEFKEQPASDTVCVTTSLHLLTLTILNQLYGLTSAEFYKEDPQRYVRTTLVTQRLLGIRKLTVGWPVYAFGAECLGQLMMYPDKQAPGADPETPLLDQTNWRELETPNFDRGIPRTVEDIVACFAELTGLEPVAHLPAPYSLAADLFGQEALLAALLQAPHFVDEFLDHLTDRIFVPWIEHLTSRIPAVWIELSDASGSPLFIGHRLFRQIAARPVRRLIEDYPWGNRVFVANYRGDHLVQKAGPQDRAARRRVRRGQNGGSEENGPKLNTEKLVELIDFKLSICPEFIIKLHADQVPLSFYVEQAIRRSKPLYIGIGATRIDRNSIVDRDAAKRDLADTATHYSQAISKVSEALARNGLPRSRLSWPGDIYIEDINAETDPGLVKTIVQTVTIQRDHL